MSESALKKFVSAPVVCQSTFCTTSAPDGEHAVSTDCLCVRVCVCVSVCQIY